MTGKEIHKMLLDKEIGYLLSKEDNLPRPIVYLTVHQLFKLRYYFELTGRTENNIIRVIEKEIDHFSYYSVIVRIKEPTK